MTDTGLAHDVTSPEDAPVAVLLGSWARPVRVVPRVGPCRIGSASSRSLRGHGGSPPPRASTPWGRADDVIRLLDGWAHGVHLVGVSMSGAVACLLRWSIGNASSRWC